MNKLLFSLLITFISTSFIYSKTIVPLEYSNGVYRIPCEINGAKVKLIFDTGASSVSLSLSMADYLYDNNYISDEDIIGSGYSSIADGSLVDHIKINLKSLIIGGVKLENVEAIVIATQDAPLLLGQSAIQKLGKFEIDGDNLIIEYGELDDEDIELLIDKITDAKLKQDYPAVIKYYEKLYEYDSLSESGIMSLANTCMANNNTEKALKYYLDLTSSKYSLPETYTDITIQINLFYLIADCFLELGNLSSARYNIKKAINLANQYNTKDSNMTSSEICKTIYSNFARKLYLDEYYDEAIDYYYKAIELWGKDHNLTVKQIFNYCKSKNPPSIIKNKEQILNLVSDYTESEFFSYKLNESELRNIMISLARNGSVNAKEFCNYNGIQY